MYLDDDPPPNHLTGQNLPARPDPYRTPVFQSAPDGQLHPVPGWKATGPFDFPIWAHNIDWPQVAKDLAHIIAGSVSGMGGSIPGGVASAYLTGEEAYDKLTDPRLQ